MTSFKFNFSGDADEVQVKDKDETKWFPCERVIPDTQILENKDLFCRAKMFMCGKVEIGYMSFEYMINQLIRKGFESTLHLNEDHPSDLVMGKYEGGLKIWECTYDLVDYFENNKSIIFKDKKVLDLGCGVGVLGIYAMMRGAHATFQDYNRDIIKYSTVSNVRLNFENEPTKHILERSEFYSGDWASFDENLEESEKFDIILTSETLYNIHNYDKLINIFKHRLNDDGEIYISSKTYYFGVGGGTREFEAALKNASLESEVIWKINSNLQREILKIKK